MIQMNLWNSQLFIYKALFFMSGKIRKYDRIIGHLTNREISPIRNTLLIKKLILPVTTL